MFGHHREDNDEVGWDMIKPVLYTFAAFVAAAVVAIIAQNL